VASCEHALGSEDHDALDLADHGASSVDLEDHDTLSVDLEDHEWQY